MSLHAHKKTPRPAPIEIVVNFIQSCFFVTILAGPITFIVPSYSIVLTRVEPIRVDAVVTRNVLFIIPTFQRKLPHIVEVGSNVTPGSAVHNSTRQSSGTQNSRSDDIGHLVFLNANDASLDVMVSPKSLADVELTIRAFLTDREESEMRIWVVSNWKFGAFLPGGIVLVFMILLGLVVKQIITGEASKEAQTSEAGMGEHQPSETDHKSL